MKAFAFSAAKSWSAIGTSSVAGVGTVRLRLAMSGSSKPSRIHLLLASSQDLHKWEYLSRLRPLS